MGNSDLWYVKLPSGDVHRVTLDQLDEAFQRGQVDLRTQVMGASTERWMTLTEILGDEEPESPAPPPAQPLAYRHVPQAPYSLRPMSVDFEDADVDVAPRRRGAGARWAFAVLAVAAAVGGVAVHRPDLRASAVARVEARIASLSAARTQTVAATSPGPVAMTPPPAAAPPATLAVAALVTAPPAAPPASSAPAGDPAVASGYAAQANHPTQQPRHPKMERKPGAASRTKTRAGGRKHASQIFTSGGNKFDPLNS
ncbi:MAG: hypothetical protein ACRENE_04035, partial [Polyangiaceae bacterium]